MSCVIRVDLVHSYIVCSTYLRPTYIIHFKKILVVDCINNNQLLNKETFYEQDNIIWIHLNPRKRSTCGRIIVTHAADVIDAYMKIHLTFSNGYERKCNIFSSPHCMLTWAKTARSIFVMWAQILYRVAGTGWSQRNLPIDVGHDIAKILIYFCGPRTKVTILSTHIRPNPTGKSLQICRSSQSGL